MRDKPRRNCYFMCTLVPNNYYPAYNTIRDNKASIKLFRCKFRLTGNLFNVLLVWSYFGLSNRAHYKFRYEKIN